mmetsp:Transcript_43087/g.113325  ORF Transcript_43087/g.113325 Transcript_43087/m.113325 type:complete len:302 (-) Transcript_43087:1009-1914(-)
MQATGPTHFPTVVLPPKESGRAQTHRLWVAAKTMSSLSLSVGNLQAELEDVLVRLLGNNDRAGPGLLQGGHRVAGALPRSGHRRHRDTHTTLCPRCPGLQPSWGADGDELLQQHPKQIRLGFWERHGLCAGPAIKRLHLAVKLGVVFLDLRLVAVGQMNLTRASQQISRRVQHIPGLADDESIEVARQLLNPAKLEASQCPTRMLCAQLHDHPVLLAILGHHRVLIKCSRVVRVAIHRPLDLVHAQGLLGKPLPHPLCAVDPAIHLNEAGPCGSKHDFGVHRPVVNFQGIQDGQGVRNEHF